MERFVKSELPPIDWRKIWKQTRKKFPQFTARMAKDNAKRLAKDEIYVNDLYQVNIARCRPPMEGWPSVIHLSVKRIDKEPIRDWRHMQQIKNELVGPEYEGIELYPAESRLVDTANQFHMWVPDSPEFRFPFGWNERVTVDGTGDLEEDNSKQRPFEVED